MKLNKIHNNAIALGFAIVIGVVLVIAAFGKMFYPLESLKIIDRSASIFEIILLVLILFFRTEWKIWWGTALVFSAWLGFALFWGTLKLPCACMGSVIRVPTLFSIVVDLLFFFSSLWVANLLGARRKWIYLNLLCSAFACLFGYLFAEWVYHYFILS